MGGGTKSRLRTLIEAVLILIILSAILLQGAVAKVYWYPLAILIVICFGLSLLGWELGFIPRPRLTGLEPYLLVWISIIILSGILSPHRWASVFALERILISTLFFYLILWHFENRTREKVLLWCLFAYPVLVSILGIGLYFFKKPGTGIIPDNIKNVSGTFINHNNFAGLVILSIFLGIGLMMARRIKRESLSEDIAQRVLFTFPLLILLLALAFSLSRSGWLAFLITIIAFFLYMALGSRAKKLKAYFSIILITVLLGLVISLILERDTLRDRAKPLNEFFTDPESGLDITGRKMLWQSTINMIKAHPFLGIGPGGFWAEYPGYRILGEQHGESHSHNDLLQLTAETGIPSSLLFLFILIQGFRVYLRNYRKEMSGFERRVSIGIIFGIIGFLIHDQVDFHFHIPGLVYYFLALTAFLLKPRGVAEREELK